MLPVTEVFHSIQGEGLNAGRTAWFVRLFGCNLACPGCDEPLHEDSSKRNQMEEEAIVDQIKDTPADLIVITGGEPALYDLTKLIQLIREKCVTHWVGGEDGHEVVWESTNHPCQDRAHKVASPIICIETNGTCAIKGEIDFICVSPKPLKYAKGNAITYSQETFSKAHEIKVVVGWTSPEELDGEIKFFKGLSGNEQVQILLSPLTTFPEGDLVPEAAQAAVDACKKYQTIRLSPQWHKWVRIR